MNTEMLVKLHRLGHTRRELPVTHAPRASGKASGANLHVIVRTFADLMAFYRQVKHEPLSGALLNESKASKWRQQHEQKRHPVVPKRDASRSA